jgi:hypothetical protein
MRLQAIGLVGILRSLTSPEVRTAIAGLPPEDSLAYVCDWLLTAGRAAGALATPIPGDEAGGLTMTLDSVVGPGEVTGEVQAQRELVADHQQVVPRDSAWEKRSA